MDNLYDNGLCNLYDHALDNQTYFFQNYSILKYVNVLTMCQLIFINSAKQHGTQNSLYTFVDGILWGNYSCFY
jgi:hypothetical protein